ncbi:hypothetical protein Forpe1208_v007114 [Fusarium oxysporum f. sp. rapae]|uniref:Uncharacterized protein n=1 Tax=Fusarium oxysporum f. sp. rapae TaxID=485398 RepID=A0A8J5NUR2_FUSOX|nr:hypothetical protein Forpe1208_v007114 [Fusarium oxysporum f. sp. rapae]
MGGYLQFAAVNKLLRKVLTSLGLTVVQHWQTLNPLLANQPVFSRIAFSTSFLDFGSSLLFSSSQREISLAFSKPDYKGWHRFTLNIPPLSLVSIFSSFSFLATNSDSVFRGTMSSPPEDSHPPGAVSRRVPLSESVSECDHALDINMFRTKWENCSDDRKRRWRRTQVYMVLRSFAKAKEVMSDRAINELCEYLKRGTWNSTARNASGHPCYKHFKGTSPCPSPFAGPYYPYFFIIQALFPLGEALKGMYRDMSDLWEMDLDPTRPFFPRLADSYREFSLIMGQKPSPQVPVPELVTMPSADQPQSPKVKAEQDSEEDNHTVKRKARPEIFSDNNSPNNNGGQLTSIRSNIKQEPSDFQAQLHKDTTGS